MDLKFVLSEDLLTELLHRYEHAVFMGVKIPTQDKDGIGEVVSLRRWFGNSYTCAGLCASLNYSILKDFSDREKESEE